MIKNLKSEVIDYEDVLLFDFGHFLDVGAVIPAYPQQCEEFLRIPVEDFLSLETGLMSESCGDVTFTYACGTGDDDVLGPVYV